MKHKELFEALRVIHGTHVVSAQFLEAPYRTYMGWIMGDSRPPKAVLKLLRFYLDAMNHPARKAAL